MVVIMGLSAISYDFWLKRILYLTEGNGGTLEFDEKHWWSLVRYLVVAVSGWLGFDQ